MRFRKGDLLIHLHNFYAPIIHVEDKVYIVKNRESYGNLWGVEIQQINGQTRHH